jgi:hypothetical protein
MHLPGVNNFFDDTLCEADTRRTVLAGFLVHGAAADPPCGRGNPVILSDCNPAILQSLELAM